MQGIPKRTYTFLIHRRKSMITFEYKTGYERFE